MKSRKEAFFFCNSETKNFVSFILKHERRMNTVRILPDMRNDLKWIMERAGPVWRCVFALLFATVRGRSDSVLVIRTLGTWSAMSSPESSPAGGMQGLLLRLHAALAEDDSRAAALTCHDIVGDLGHECMLVLTDNELGKTPNVTPIKKTHPCLTSRHSAPAPNPIYKLCGKQNSCHSCVCDNPSEMCRVS